MVAAMNLNSLLMFIARPLPRYPEVSLAEDSKYEAIRSFMSFVTLVGGVGIFGFPIILDLIVIFPAIGMTFPTNANIGVAILLMGVSEYVYFVVFEWFIDWMAFRYKLAYYF